MILYRLGQHLKLKQIKDLIVLVIIPHLTSATDAETENNPKIKILLQIQSTLVKMIIEINRLSSLVATTSLGAEN